MPNNRTLAPLALAPLVMVLAVAVALAGWPVATARAQSQVSCDWYARTALDQQRRNLERGCGFQGPSWSSDRARHLAWCRTSSPDEWKRQAQMREQQLAKCPVR